MRIITKFELNHTKHSDIIDFLLLLCYSIFMELTPSHKQNSYTELPESEAIELETDNGNELTEYPEVQTTPSAESQSDIKEKDSLKKKLIKIGSIAITAAATYGAFKSGMLDSIPINHSDEVSVITTSAVTGFVASQTYGMINSFRKK